MPWLSTAKQTAILASVQLNPEIGTDDSAFVTSKIEQAARWLTSQIHVDRYPELSQGYSVSGASPSTDITGLSTNEILVSIDDDQFQTIELTLTGLNTGADIATELQTQIRSGVDSYKFATVTYADGVYTITSPTFGEASIVNVSYSADYEDVAQALQLSPIYGGTEYSGGLGDPSYDDMVIRIVQHWYNQVGVEGMRSFSIPGAVSATDSGVDPVVVEFINDNRRLVR